MRLVCPEVMSPNLTDSDRAFGSVKACQNASAETENPLVKSRSVKQAKVHFNSRIFLPEEPLKSC